MLERKISLTYTVKFNRFINDLDIFLKYKRNFGIFSNPPENEFVCISHKLKGKKKRTNALIRISPT